jgi:hypothetical protein
MSALLISKSAIVCKGAIIAGSKAGLSWYSYNKIKNSSIDYI